MSNVKLDIGLKPCQELCQTESTYYVFHQAAADTNLELHLSRVYMYTEIPLQGVAGLWPSNFRS